MAEYELWLTDDRGVRMAALQDFGEPAFFSYTRAVGQMGVFNLGIPFKPWAKKMNPYFVPDWRIEVWRSPAYGIPMRREDVFMLRKHNTYIRGDSVEMIQFNGRNGLDLLNRRSVIQHGGSSQATKTQEVDDMMKEVVREQMLYGSTVDEDGAADNTRAYPEDEFRVQADTSLGPSVTLSFADKKVLDILKELKEASFQLNISDSDLYRKIFFDVIPISLAAGAASTGALLGWLFITKADLYGVDRTTGAIFSVENENLKSPSYSLSHLDEVNSVYVRGNGTGNSQPIEPVSDSQRIFASRWNRSESVISASSETTTAGLQSAGNTELYKNRPQEELNVVLINSPGRKDVPQSLYGIDWDIGDLVRVDYAKKQFNVEINIVYVSVDENGKETITGRNEVSQ